MTGRIALALTLHNHQPIGNFGWVVEEVFRQAYAPMVEALGRHPRVRMGLHYSGPLLEWLQAEQPGFIADLRGLVERGQVEILGGGLYEPVLAALPERDRAEQLTRLADIVEDTFGQRPRGAWLAERVWEPDVPASIVDAGYDWTILDDAHLRAGAVPEDAMWGPYSTDDRGRRLTVFGTEQGLRYRIPFQEVEAVVDHLRAHATPTGERVGTMGDDGEKFGAWPSTFEHCWGRGRWVGRFFDALEGSTAWLQTVRPSDWLDGHDPLGRVAIPTGSYAEMGEWALPPEESRAFGRALRAAREAGSPTLRWLRGAPWRNFQVKYREVNDLHKQMLRASAKVAAMAAGPDREQALDHLLRGQSNDCYWHGLFGGIYIGHMRAATLRHLIAAEDLADRAAGAHDVSDVRDLDLDGRPEAILATAGQVVVVKPDAGAGIGTWDLRAPAHALAAVLRRRPEAYHDTLRAHDDATAPAAGSAAADEAASIHDVVQVKEAGLAARLVYDDFERRLGLVRFLAPETTPEVWGAGGRDDLGDAVDGAYDIDRIEPGRLRLTRRAAVSTPGGPIRVGIELEMRLVGGRLDPVLEHDVVVTNEGEHVLEARVGTEWAFALLGGGANPDAWWAVDGVRVPHDSAGSAGGMNRVGQGNAWLGVEVETMIEPSVDAWFAPIETISNSEAGFERAYQGGALLLSLPVALQPGARWSLSTRHRASTREAFTAARPATDPA